MQITKFFERNLFFYRVPERLLARDNFGQTLSKLLRTSLTVYMVYNIYILSMICHDGSKDEISCMRHHVLILNISYIDTDVHDTISHSDNSHII